MTKPAKPPGSVRRTAIRLAVFAGLVYVLTGGGRIVGSDELAMLELSRAMLHGGIAVPAGATLRGPDGRDYTKNAAAQAVIALPVVAAAEVGARVAGLSAPRAELAVRFAASFLNALVTAVLLGVFYAGARGLGVGRGAALLAALLLGFATPVWPYAKTFMAEPLQALGLLMAALGAAGVAHASEPARRTAVRLAAAGVFVAVSVKLSMLPLALATLAPLLASRPRTWVWPAGGLAAALAGHAAYNVARFGTPFETGYGAQATAAAYTTPLLVGLYGLLLSSGKGVAWFAPPVWLAPLGARRAGGAAEAQSPARLGLGVPRGRLVWSAALAWAAALALYAPFEHWAGDGSFGPRYLVPVLPLALLLVAFALDGVGGSVRRRAFRIAILLGALGGLVQIGGVGIYFGAQMREAGDYPYRLPLNDPRSLADSHFNPRFSPIAGHLSMLARNLGEHLSGRAPRLELDGVPNDRRVGLGAEAQRDLLRGIDLWWLYLGYAGFGPLATLLAPLLVLLAAIVAGLALRRALVAEAAAP